MFLLDKNSRINILIILLGHKTLVCYLYLICLREIQYLWRCAMVLTGILISGRSCEQLFFLFLKKNKAFLWSVLFDGRSASIIVITEETRYSVSLVQFVIDCEKHLISEHVSHVTALLQSCSNALGYAKYYKKNKSVCSVPLATNLMSEI